MNPELPDIPVGFRKGRGTRDQIAYIHWIIEKVREFQKTTTTTTTTTTSISALLTMPKPFTVWIATNCRKFLERWETGPPDMPLEKPICTSGSNS